MSAVSSFVKKIDDNLSIYRSTRGDSERLGKFYSTAFTAPDGSPDNSHFYYVDDLLTGKHPTFHEDDFVFVEEQNSHKIVSAMNLISQTWTYGGIPIPAGRPEMVATDPDFRNRGLVRALFEVVHEWSRQRGELMLGITGIPYYYRLFGYEMCVTLEGGRSGTPDCLPAIPKDKLDTYKIREAGAEDIPFIAGLYQQNIKRLLLSCPREEAVWQNDMFVRSPKSDDYRVIWIIESPQHEPLGFFLHFIGLGPEYISETELSCYWYELKQGVSFLEVTPFVLQHLLTTGQKYALEKGKTCSGIGMYLDSDHPAYQVLENSLPRKQRDYAWYMRVPDLPTFLRKVAPVLETRLANSWCSGHTGELSITFYRSKLKIDFQHGKLVSIQQTPFTGDQDCQASFPDLTFLQLLFGYRSLDEIRHMFPDCLVDDQSGPLLKALFPTCASNIWPR